MKATLTNPGRFLLALLLAAFGFVHIAEATKAQLIWPAGSAAAARAALTRRTTIGMDNEPILTGMHRLSEWVGSNEVLIDPELLEKHPHYSLPLMYGITVEEVVKVLRVAFKEQARVGWEDLPDGVLHFAGLKADGGIPPADMKNVRIIWRAHAATGEILLHRMRAWSGKEIRFDSAALAGLAPIMLDVGTTPQTTSEMFFAAGTALMKAGVLLYQQPDGSYRAHLAAKPAPPAVSTPVSAAKQP